MSRHNRRHAIFLSRQPLIILYSKIYSVCPSKNRDHSKPLKRAVITLPSSPPPLPPKTHCSHYRETRTAGNCDSRILPWYSLVSNLLPNFSSVILRRQLVHVLYTNCQLSHCNSVHWEVERHTCCLSWTKNLTFHYPLFPGFDRRRTFKVDIAT